MAGKVSVTREWGDGTYCFRVGRPEWLKIEKRFDVGPMQFIRHLTFGTWKTDYPREIIRLALQAGGSVLTESGAIDDKRINRLIEDYVDERMFEAALFAADWLTETYFPSVTAPKGEGVDMAEMPIAEAAE